MDLLLPTTDAGVAAQVVIATIVFAGLLWRLWANKDARIFVIEMAMLTFGAMGVRALHSPPTPPVPFSDVPSAP